MNNIGFEIINKLFNDITKCQLDKTKLAKLNNIKQGEFELKLDYEDDGYSIEYAIDLYELDKFDKPIDLSFTGNYSTWLENILNDLDIEHDYNQLYVITPDQLNYLLRLAYRIGTK